MLFFFIRDVIFSLKVVNPPGSDWLRDDPGAGEFDRLDGPGFDDGDRFDRFGEGDRLDRLVNGDRLDGPGVDEGDRLDGPGLGDSEVVEFYGMDCLTLDVRS